MFFRSTHHLSMIMNFDEFSIEDKEEKIRRGISSVNIRIRNIFIYRNILTEVSHANVSTFSVVTW